MTKYQVMTKHQVMTKIAAILMTLEETDGSSESISMLYIFCDMNMDNYQIIRDILVRGGFVTIKENYVTLTELGKKTAKKLNQEINK